MTEEIHRQITKIKALERWENEGGRIRTEETHSNAIYEMGPRREHGTAGNRNDMEYQIE
jgi:hypothetical protein